MVEALHGADILHADIKADNFLLQVESSASVFQNSSLPSLLLLHSAVPPVHPCPQPCGHLGRGDVRRPRPQPAAHRLRQVNRPQAPPQGHPLQQGDQAGVSVFVHWRLDGKGIILPSDLVSGVFRRCTVVDR